MNTLQDLTALRLYFPQSARAKPTRLWHHLSAPALSHRLMTAARRAGIHQALLHSVHAGYLPGKRLSHAQLEGAPAHHPLCIELIDMEERLRKFLTDHADELLHVRAVLFRCEVAL
jgi:PII-like signaling protein